MKRRNALTGIGGLLLAPTLAFNEKKSIIDKPVLRLAHITDVHLKNEFNAPTRFTKCLQHIQEQSPKVDFIVNGGDIVFDMNKENISSIDNQWELFHDIMKKECSLPAYYCLGNHDVWWFEINKTDILYGKKYSLDQLNLKKPYYSLIKNGWKFIFLDSTHLDVDKTWYIGKLDQGQFEWLSKELSQTPKEQPVMIISHIPILTALLMIEDNIVNKWQMLGGEMHTDTAKIINLFYQHKNVKLCVSGHLHMRDKVIYNDVTYLCNGAVSGAWWEGNRRETQAGYGLIDLFADGSFEEKYVNY